MIILWENIKANRSKTGKLWPNNHGYLWVVGLWQYLYCPVFKLSTLSRYYFNNQQKLISAFG